MVSESKTSLIPLEGRHAAFVRLRMCPYRPNVRYWSILLQNDFEPRNGAILISGSGASAQFRFNRVRDQSVEALVGRALYLQSLALQNCSSPRRCLPDRRRGRSASAIRRRRSRPEAEIWSPVLKPGGQFSVRAPAELGNLCRLSDHHRLGDRRRQSLDRRWHRTHLRDRSPADQ